MTNKRIANIANQSDRNRAVYWYTGATALVMTLAMLPIATHDEIDFWYTPIAGTLLFALTLILPEATKTSEKVKSFWYTGAGILAVLMASSPLYAENVVALWYVPLVSILFFAIALVIPDALIARQQSSETGSNSEMRPMNTVGVTSYRYSKAANEHVSKTAA